MSQAAKNRTQLDIEAVFARGAEAWNRRDLDGYLSIYGDGKRVRWVSGGRMITGKAAIREALEPRFLSGEPMGHLTLDNLQIDIETRSEALVFGTFQLQFEEETVEGVFTVHLERTAGKWVILSDHASVLTPTPNPPSTRSGQRSP